MSTSTNARSSQKSLNIRLNLDLVPDRRVAYVEHVCSILQDSRMGHPLDIFTPFYAHKGGNTTGRECAPVRDEILEPTNSPYRFRRAQRKHEPQLSYSFIEVAQLSTLPTGRVSALRASPAARGSPSGDAKTQDVPPPVPAAVWRASRPPVFRALTYEDDHALPAGGQRYCRRDGNGTRVERLGTQISELDFHDNEPSREP